MQLRPMTGTDRRYVAATWAHSSRYEGLQRAERFELVDRLLDSGARVVVAAGGRTVHAWACGDGGVLHYAYVPPELRRHGLGRMVIEDVLGSYTDHIDVTHVWPGKSGRFRYRPHLLWRTAA